MKQHLRILLAAATLGSSGVAFAQQYNLTTGYDQGTSSPIPFFGAEDNWVAVRWALGPTFNANVANPTAPTYADYLTAFGAGDLQSVDLDAVDNYFGDWATPSTGRWIQPTSSLTVTYTDSLGVETASSFTESSTLGNNYRTNQAGNYAYIYAFNLTESALLDPTLSFTFQYSTDNASSVYVNGNFVATRGEVDYGSLSGTVDATSELVLGVNTVVVVVQNDFRSQLNGGTFGLNLAEFNPTGLLFIGNVIPEPSTYALLGGLATLAVLALRRRRS